MNNFPLHIDQIITSEPGLGPTPPDGGYGWAVLVACICIQLTIPSLLASYGTYLLFDQIENVERDDVYQTWDHEITLVPIIFVAFGTITELWCFDICKKIKWPRLVVFSGVCLTISGNLIAYAAELHEPTIILYYFIAGALSGTGASLIMQQCEYLIRQYFQQKYRVAKNILYLSHIIGFILAPLIMGNMIVRHGVLECMLGYQAFLALVAVAAVVFRQPDLIYPENRTYKLLDSSSGDDERLVFDKVVIEVQPSTSSTGTGLESFKPPHQRETKPIQDLDAITKSEDPNSAKVTIRRSFSNEYKNDLSRTIDPSMNENSSFSYENQSVYKTTSSRSGHVDGKVLCLSMLQSPIFYKFILLIFVEKLSILVFWTLYPSVMYDEVNELNVHTTIMCITFVAIGGLVFTVFWNCFLIPRGRVKFFLSTSFFLASIGFTIIHSSTSKNWLLFGGILSTASLSSMRVFTETFILQNGDGINTQAHKFVNVIVGLTIFSIAFLDIEYIECFEAASLLQLFVGSLWLTNIFYKKIKKLFVS